MLIACPEDPEIWLAVADIAEEEWGPEVGRYSRLSTFMRCYEPSCREEFDAWQTEQQILLNRGVRPTNAYYTNSLGMKLALVPPGSFIMGEPATENTPDTQHGVELTDPYYVGIYPCTQEEYRMVMGVNPAHFRKGGGGESKVVGLDTDNFPVECVSWDSANEFCKKLTEMDKTIPEGYEYSLPTEAEWEFACRAGSDTPFYFGNKLTSYQANFDGNYPFGCQEKGPFLQRPSVVGSYKPNAFGIYDMHGNVWEWCLDCYDPNFYAECKKKAEEDKYEVIKPRIPTWLSR